MTRARGRYFRDVVVTALTLFFLESERDTTDGTLLDALHQVRDVSSNLVAKTLGGHIGHLVADTLFVRMERIGLVSWRCTLLVWKSRVSLVKYFSTMMRAALLVVLVRTRPCRNEHQFGGCGKMKDWGDEEEEKVWFGEGEGPWCVDLLFEIGDDQKRIGQGRRKSGTQTYD